VSSQSSQIIRAQSDAEHRQVSVIRQRNGAQRRSFVRSAAMQDALRELEAAVGSLGGVLLCGEPGSGRDLFARAIHHAGMRPLDGPIENLLRRAMREPLQGRPFVPVDCGDRESLEERLFGRLHPGSHDQGALDSIDEGCALQTGFGGTLYLRQLTDMPPRIQNRLARILRDGEVFVHARSGLDRIHQVAVRLIATTERQDPSDLASDLQLRVSRAVISVPPLRARREDIPGLVRCLASDLALTAGLAPKAVSTQAIDLLSALPWRGNVSELEALLRRLVAKVPGRQIRLSDVLAHVRLDGQPTAAMYGGTLKEARESFERDYVAAVLEQHRGRMGEAAKALGLQRTNLYRKVRQLSVRRRSGRQLS